MNLQALLLFPTALASVLAAGGASAQTTYFADDFEDASDSTTFLGNISPGDPVNGDADPDAPQAGVWDVIAEPYPYKIQVTQGQTFGAPGSASYPGPGSASGINALAIERFDFVGVPPGATEARGAFNAVATGLVAVDFDLWVNYGQAQFFLRNGTLGGYDGYPFLVNFTAAGQVQLNNGPLTAAFYTVDDGQPSPGPETIDYNHVQVMIDLTAQSFSLTVDGASLPALTNVAFPTDGSAGTQPVSQLQQIIFGEPTGEGAFYIDNVIVRGVASANSADFDGDSDVDGADFLIWQRGVGTASPGLSDGDANSDGNVNGLDLDIWKLNFGVPQAQVAASAIPEPSSVVLLGLAGLATAVVYHKGPMRSRMHR